MVTKLNIRKAVSFSMLPLWLFLLIPMGLIAADPDPTADQIAQKMQDHYQNVTNFKADFVQTTAHKMFAGHFQRSYGQVMFKDGGLMRWEYQRPDKKLFVYDGTVLWVYEPEVPQVFKGSANADRMKRALSFMTGQGKIKDSYKIRKVNATAYGYSQGFVLILTPKEKNSPFKQIELYLDKETFSVARSVVIDHEGNRNRLDFSNTKNNLTMDAGLFAFTPPANVPIVSADQ